MKTLSKKLCPQCNKEFEYESWNKKKTYCSMVCKISANTGSRITKDDWINRAKNKHGDKYLYETVDLSNKIDGKVAILCKIHGMFMQDPHQHLIGKGCKKCAHKKQFLTTQEFIEKSSKKHNNKYTYLFTEYKSLKEHVIITCPLHGNFLQSPTQHLHHGAGCHICSQIYTTSKGEIDWLDSCSIDNRQVEIIIDNKKYIVDGLKDTTIYEYLGDYWHGNPNKFSKSEINPQAKKSFGDLYSETLSRFDVFRSKGYNVIHIWESEWHQTK